MTVTLPASTFVAARAAVTLAASRDDARPILCGVHVTAGRGRLVIEATDSYRIHRVDIPHPGRKLDVIVDAAWLDAIRLPKDGRVNGKPVDVTLAARAGRFTVTCDTDQWSTSCIDTSDVLYPDTAKVIGTEPEHDPDLAEIAFNPRFYADAMKASAKWGDADGVPVRVLAAGALKPCRFVTFRRNGDVENTARLDVALMPVRIP